jgi:hypothetical protein
MMYWLSRIFLICLVLGGIQWGMAHPDSQFSQWFMQQYFVGLSFVKGWLATL